MTHPTTLVALFVAGHVLLMWIVRITNERGDEIRSGVVKGNRTPKRTRMLMLYTQYLPYCVFGWSYIVIIALGFLITARGIEERSVRVFAYLCATHFAFSALFVGVLVPFLFWDMRRAVLGTPGEAGTNLVST
jgi:hypothetical protein